MKSTKTIYLQCKSILDALIQDEESRAFFGPMLDMAGSAFEHDNSVYLKRLLKELQVLSQDFPDRITAELLREINLPVPDIRQEVAAVLRQGKIKNAEQFYFINEYIDQVHQNPEMTPVVEALNSMLLAFEKNRRN